MADVKDSCKQFPLCIDLNEIPDETLPVVDAYTIVKRFHESPKVSVAAPAEYPGEPGVGRSYACGLCGRPESKGSTIICDGCERGFHMTCVRLRARQTSSLEDWICGDCVRNDTQSKRWKLGAVKQGGFMPLDINALPPMDGDGEIEGREEEFRRNTGTQTSSSNSHKKNEFEQGKANSNELFPHQRSIGSTSFKGRTVNGSPAVRVSNRIQAEMFLQSLKDYIIEKQGILEDGWHVEFQQCSNRCDAYAVYCAPDGKRLESMFDVACYLGLESNCTPPNIEDRNDGFVSSLQKVSVIRRKKELARVSKTNNVKESRECLRNGHGEFFCDTEIVTTPSCNSESNLRILGSDPMENGGGKQLTIELPVQCEDFMIHSLGEIDSRPAYHSTYEIWPVGYTSSWHDRVTGSLFKCEVSDGGDSMPHFKIKRIPCSAVSMPIGATIVFVAHNSISHICEKIESDGIIHSNYDEDENIEMILSDPTDSHQDFLSCFSSSSMDWLSSAVLNQRLYLEDEIGEFLVEERSSSLAWRLASQTLLDACRRAYKEQGKLQFLCKHREVGVLSSYPLELNTPIGKLCSFYGPSFAEVPYVIQSDDELVTLCRELEKWIDQDRFGLDIEFVQEIIEQLPGVHACFKYVPLNKRDCHSMQLTVGSGLLSMKQMDKIEDGSQREESMKPHKEDTFKDSESDVHHPPLGKHLSTTLPSQLVSDVLQICEFLLRFHDILGLKEPVPYKKLEKELLNPWIDESNVIENGEKETKENGTQVMENMGMPNSLSTSRESQSPILETNYPNFVQLETRSIMETVQIRRAASTYGRCTGFSLTKIHFSMLKVLLDELQSKLAPFVDPNFDMGESRSRRGRKKETDNANSSKKVKIDSLPINELTWPELARRYILSILAMDGSIDSSEVISRESGKVFRCLKGDGGVLCGAMAGVAGMKTDALMLAEAQKQVSDYGKKNIEVMPMDMKMSDKIFHDASAINGNSIPEWAQLLEPVRKLPTNVGTRIRKCVYDALEKGPPEWAKQRLEHSISKEVYKGNASGPTKKAVLAVLSEVYAGSAPEKLVTSVKKENKMIPISDIVMKQCRSILRHAISSDEAKIFCNLLGTTLSNNNDNEDEGLLGSPAMVSRPLDFRTIDLRLAVGAYGTSHEAFLCEVREVWHNIRTAYGERPDLMELAETLSQEFETLYEKEVLTLINSYSKRDDSTCSNASEKKLDILSANEIPKAPWEEGVCKVCGIDKDDDSVLLCDTCDSEYHTYCLSPPLARIPEGNWYCPSCVSGQDKIPETSQHSLPSNQHVKRRYQGEEACLFFESLSQLATTMEEKEYWELTINERTFLLKFLCDELLNSALIRDHLDQCSETSVDLQQKLRLLSLEWRELKCKETSTSRADAENLFKYFENGEGTKEVVGITKSMAHASNFMESTTSYLQQNVCNSVEHSIVKFGQNIVPNHSEKLKSHNSKKLDNEIQSFPNCASTVIKPNEIEPQMVSGFSKDGKSSLILTKKNVSSLLIAPSLAISQNIGDRSDVQELLADNESLPKVNVNEGEDLCRGKSESCHLSSSSTLTCSLGQTSDPVQLSQQSIMFVNSDIPNCPTVPESQPAANIEPVSLKANVSHLQESIAIIESQLFQTSLRRDFLGRDSSGRLYWILGSTSKSPQLVVHGSILTPSKGETKGEPLFFSNNAFQFKRDAYLSALGSFDLPKYDFKGDHGRYCTWTAYESDSEIQALLDWLRDGDPVDKNLKEIILQWLRLESRYVNKVDDDSQSTPSETSTIEIASAPETLITNASKVLEKRYGPCIEIDAEEILKRCGKKGKNSNEIRMYRCECLEPVWPSRRHCLSCHHTFSTNTELDDHDEEKCMSNLTHSSITKGYKAIVKNKESKVEIARIKDFTGDNGISNAAKSGGKSDLKLGMSKFQKKLDNPYDIEVISRTFVMKNSNRDLVQQIGLIGSNGKVSFVPNPHYYVDPALQTQNLVIGSGTAEKLVHSSLLQENNCYIPCPRDSIGRKSGKLPEIQIGSVSNMTSESVDREKFPSVNVMPEIELNHTCKVPESSLRPLVGKVSQILRRMKINVLDMEAALHEESLRLSKANLSKRRAWRSFVKTAVSIFEMVQATIVLEDMINSEYLKTGWWYWSSLSAAAKISTVSSLALRIYTLDDCIMYEKMPPSCEPTDYSRPIKVGKKRKDADPS